MRLTLLSYDLYLPGCHSLKEKRRHIKSIKDRIRSRFNVSVAEVGNQEIWQQATLAVAWVASDGENLDSVASKIETIVLRPGDVEILKVVRNEY